MIKFSTVVITRSGPNYIFSTRLYSGLKSMNYNSGLPCNLHLTDLCYFIVNSVAWWCAFTQSQKL